MPQENSLTARVAPIPSLESLKKTFQQRLAGILGVQLTVENIEAFASEALQTTIKLTEDILTEYRRNPASSATGLSGAEEEDAAFKVFDLPDISQILDSIMNLQEEIESLQEYLGRQTEQTSEVNTPPATGSGVKIQKGAGGWQEKKIFPRLLTLLYILEHDFDIPLSPSDVPISWGDIEPDMMRQTPYARVEIPVLQRVVYLCEEEGNASYIFDTERLEKIGLTSEELRKKNKEEKKQLITLHPGIGIRLVQSPNWRENMAEYLREIGLDSEKRPEKIPSQSRENEEGGVTRQTSRGELDPWRGFWTDEEGGHWANIHTLASYFQIKEITIKHYVDITSLTSIRIKNNKGQISDAFCFEDLEANGKFMIFIKLPQTERSGEWRNFYIDPSGKHWAATERIAKRLSLNPRTIRRLIENNIKEFSLMDLRNSMGQKWLAFCLEEIEEFIKKK